MFKNQNRMRNLIYKIFSLKISLGTPCSGIENYRLLASDFFCTPAYEDGVNSLTLFATFLSCVCRIVTLIKLCTSE